MASKYRTSQRKKHNTELEVAARRLSTDNYLMKMLIHHHSKLNKQLERFLTLETQRVEGSQQLRAKNKNALTTEQLCETEDDQMDRGSTSDEQVLTDDIRTLQNNLKDALEKNKLWLEYDQQREAYVRAVLARMLWLEEQLNEANRACLQQHNEDHSDEKAQISKLQELYESLLQAANNELEVIRHYFGEISQELIRIQNSFKAKEEEVEELRQQCQALKTSTEGEIDVWSWSNEEEQQRTEELSPRLDEEKHTSAYLEQENWLESVFIDTHKANQQKIADLERQVTINSQDLEDARQDCLYLREQIVKLLKKLQCSRGQKISKKEQQGPGPFGVAFLPSPTTKDGLQSSPNSSLLDDSCVECPLCQTQYPAQEYRDLIDHLEVCHD